jgi:AdoMet-dependent heme synthase
MSDKKPSLVAWELTAASDSACVHCRASAQAFRSGLELSTDEGKRLIDEIAAVDVANLLMTGGDPFARSDLFELIEYAADRGIRVSLTLTPTSLLTNEQACGLKRSGLARLAVSVDGSTAAAHDSFCLPNSFERALETIHAAHLSGLSVQIDTMVTRRTVDELEAIAELISDLDVDLWNVFFPVPSAHLSADDLLTADEFETVFAKLYEISRSLPFEVNTSEAQHYRRYVLQRRARELAAQDPELTLQVSLHGNTHASGHMRDDKSFVFISHTGLVYPSGFLPAVAGNIRDQSLAEIYRNAPLLQQLRDDSRLTGKCGICEFVHVCGGSRARAFAVSGDAFAEEPCCAYVPKRAQQTDLCPA